MNGSHATFPAWIEAAVAFVTILGILFYGFKGANSKATVADLRSKNNDLRADRDDDRLRIADLEKQVAAITTEMNTRVAALGAQVAQLTEANRVLANTVTAADKIKAAADQAAIDHAASMELLGDIRDVVTAIKEAQR